MTLPRCYPQCKADGWIPDRCPGASVLRARNAGDHHRPTRRAPRGSVLGRLAAGFALLLGVASATRGQAALDSGEAIACFGELRAGLNAWGEGGEIDEATSITDPSGATGAAITLRLGGRVIGRGDAFEGDRGSVHAALLEAWGEAERDLIVEDDDSGDRRRALAGRITIELEVAGELRPLVGATFDVAGGRLSPGIDGAAVRVGERVAGVFPGLQLTSSLSPGRALRVAAGELDLPPIDLERLRRDFDITLYAFRTQHLAEIRPGEPAQFLHRGGTIVSPMSVSGPRLREAADGIARHLATHVWAGEEPFGLTGNYEPTTGRYDPLIGGPRSQALVAFALARYAHTPGVDETLAGASLELAASILDDLRTVGADESDPTVDPVASAMWLIGWSEMMNAGGRQSPELERYASVAVGTLTGAMDDPAIWVATSEGARALIAHALARSWQRNLAPGLEARARGLVRELFLSQNTAQLAALMPWIGWAELELSGDTVPAAVKLRDFRDMVWSFQLDYSPLESTDADLAGGIVFTRGGARLPTWQSLRPLAFLATMLGHPDLTESGELLTELAAMRRSLRFLLQLTVREAELHMMVSERRASGGVRRALWDQTESLDANALGLLTLCEVLRVLDARWSAPEDLAPQQGSGAGR